MKLFLMGVLMLSSPSVFAVGFAEGTLIRTPKDQYVPIEEIKVNDEVVSCFKGTCEKGRVSSLEHLEDQTTIQMLTSKNELLVSAEDQTFLSKDGHWMEAKDLRPGDLLKSPDGYICILEVKKGAVEAMYGFEVEEFHNFYTFSSLAHNVYGQGNGPYGQAYAAGHSNGVGKNVDMQAVACYGKAAVGGCVSNAAQEAARGGVSPKDIVNNCASGAIGGVAGALAIGACNTASGSTFTHNSSFNQSVFDSGGGLQANDRSAYTPAEGYGYSENQSLVDSVGNNTATSPKG